MNAYIVVEGNTDATLITKLLPAEIQQQTAVVVGGGRANLTSSARTLLVTKRKPLALLIDSDTLDENSVVERRRETEGLLRAVSGGVPFKVFVIVPAIEALLFRVSAAVERITGKKFSAENLALSRFQPQQAILQLGQNKSELFEQIIDGLSSEDLDQLRGTSPIKELIEFLAEMLLPALQSQTA